MNETSQYRYLFDLAGDPKALWDARAEIPGLGSVMSLGKSEQIREKETELVKEHLFSELGDLSGKSVLEIGTGIGRFTGELDERASSVVSIDISRRMINRALSARKGRTTFIQALGQNLPLRENLFDIVFESTVLIHLNDGDFNSFVKEAMRVLKPGGKVVFFGFMASDHATQIHPYLKHRTISEHEQAAGIPLKRRGSIELSNGTYHLLIGGKPLS